MTALNLLRGDNTTNIEEKGLDGIMDLWVEVAGTETTRQASRSLEPSSSFFIYISTVSTLSSTHHFTHKFCVGTYQNPYLSRIPTQSPLLFHSLISPKNLDLLVTRLTLLASPMATTASFSDVRIHAPSSTCIDRTTLFAQPSVSFSWSAPSLNLEELPYARWN